MDWAMTEDMMDCLGSGDAGLPSGTVFDAENDPSRVRLLTGLAAGGGLKRRIVIYWRVWYPRRSQWCVDGVVFKYEGRRKVMLCAVELGFILGPEEDFVVSGMKG